MKDNNDKKIRRWIALLGVLLAAAVAAIAFLVVQPVGSASGVSGEDVKTTSLQVSQPSEEEFSLKTLVTLGTAAQTSTNKEQEEKKNSSTSDAQEKRASQNNNTEQSDNKASNTSENTAPNNSTDDQTDVQDSEYIFADSSDRLLTDADIRGMSAKELNYAKNEIYARHGRIFNSQELADYFKSKSWYEGTRSPSDFDDHGDSILSETEKKNIEFLKKAEEALQPGGYDPQ